MSTWRPVTPRRVEREGHFGHPNTTPSSAISTIHQKHLSGPGDGLNLRAGQDHEVVKDAPEWVTVPIEVALRSPGRPFVSTLVP